MTPEASATQSDQLDQADASDEAVWLDEDWLVAAHGSDAPVTPLSTEAIAVCELWTLEGLYAAIETLPDQAWPYKVLGDFWRDRRPDLAVAAYCHTLACEPNQFTLLTMTASLAVSQKQTAIAKDLYYQAIGYLPHRPEPFYNLGRMADEAGEAHPAVVLYSQALMRDPTFGPVYVSLGNAWGRMGDWLRALATYGAGLQHPDCVSLAELYHGQGRAHEKLGNLAGALGTYEAAIAEKPAAVEYQCSLALLLLKMGNWERGWAVYEWRLRQPFYGSLLAECQPRWTGDDLTGQTLLVRSEQGLGDTIQFCRYLPRLRERAARLIFRGRACLRELVMTVGGVDEFVDWETPLDGVVYDRAVPLMSVPQYFAPEPAIAAEATAAQPVYLQVPERVKDFELPAPAAGTGGQGTEVKKVGLVWASGYRDLPELIEQYHEKTCDVAELMGAIAPSDNQSEGQSDSSAKTQTKIQCYSLQVGRDVPSGQRFYEDGSLIDLSDRLGSFSETAAAIAQLDLVISVDTAVAHLAGALGKPVWIMLPWQADWRWLCDRSDSVWYTTARLFRQTAVGDWASVYGAISQALAEELGGE